MLSLRYNVIRVRKKHDTRRTHAPQLKNLYDKQKLCFFSFSQREIDNFLNIFFESL